MRKIADTDKTIGLVMTVASIIIILLELIVLIVQPLWDTTILRDLPPGQYWALAFPTFIALVGVLGITAWIGVTMIKTPPPQEWEFEDIEEGMEEETTAEPVKTETKKVAKGKETKKETEPKTKAKSKAKSKAKAEPEEKQPEPEVKVEPKTVVSTSGLELTEIKGLGASKVDDLKAGGFDTVEKIANATVEDLSKIKGIGKATAQKYIDGAKDLIS